MKTLLHIGALLLVCAVNARANLSDPGTVSSLESAAKEGKSPHFSITSDEAKENPATVLDLHRLGVKFEIPETETEVFLAQLEESFVSESVADVPMHASKDLPVTFYFGVGLSSISYSGADRSTFDSINSVPGLSHRAYDLDLLGLYWTYEPFNLMFGGTLNLLTERWSDDSAVVTMKDYVLSASALYFPFGKPGDGFYFRGDLGLARYDLGIEFINDASSFGESSWGLGMLLGAGYAFPLWGHLHGTLKASYSYRTADHSNAGVLSAGAGIFF